MPGVPKSHGCTVCQRRKKKCDEVKPTCGLCARLGLQCVGNGTRRWKFLSYQDPDAQPHDGCTPTPPASAPPRSKAPSKPKTKSPPQDKPSPERLVPAPTRQPMSDVMVTRAALVHLLEIKDVRYDLRAFGTQMMTELPRLLGVCDELDTAASALVFLCKSRHYNLSKLDAITRYGKALATMRKGMYSGNDNPSLKMQAVNMMFISQAMLDRRHADKHRIMIVRMFRESAINGTVSQINPAFIYGLCQMAVWVALLDPTFLLEAWFWDMLSTCSAARPRKITRNAFRGLEAATMAEGAVFLRDPGRHAPQLREIHRTYREERPRMAELATMAAAAALAAEHHGGGAGGSQSARHHNEFLKCLAIMLGQEAMLGCVLRALYPSDPSFLDSAFEVHRATSVLARQCESFRPYGSSFLPDALQIIWASLGDVPGAEAELEWYMLQYEKDVEGADYMGGAWELRRRLEDCTRPYKQPKYAEAAWTQTDQHLPVIQDDEIGPPACVIL